MPASTEVVPVWLTTQDGVRLAAEFRPAVRTIAADAPDAAAPASPGADDGRRTACVVAHGFTGSARQADVRRICTVLSSAGFAVLASDFRGHGRSGGLGTAGVDEVHDVAAGVAWLRERGFDAVVTLGWSMGGTAVLRHAGLGGDSDAVVSVSAPGLWWERGTRPMRIVHWMFETRSGRAATRVLRRTRVSPVGWDGEPEDPATLAGRIAPRPLLVVHGDADRYFPLRHVEAIAAAAPTATVWIEPGMGHAEVATTGDLLERVVVWLHDAVGLRR